MSTAISTAMRDQIGATAYRAVERTRPPAEARFTVAPGSERNWGNLSFSRDDVPASALLDWRRTVQEADQVSSLLALLRLANFGEAADRIADLSRPGDALDDDEEPASIAAIKAFALMIRDLIGLGEPLIALSVGGALVAEWQIAADRHVALKFLAEDRVSFALIAPAAAQSPRSRLSGTATRAEVMKAMRAFGIERWRLHEG